MTDKESLHFTIDLTDAAHRLRHSNIVPDYPCSGKVIQLDKLSTEYAQVALCSSCGTEFLYEPDSDWVTVISLGMRDPV